MGSLHFQPFSQESDGGRLDDVVAPDLKVTAPDSEPPQCAKAPKGTSCVPEDPCQKDGECDGKGQCKGTPMTCSAPNASGKCSSGVCKGFVCSPGWGNCNADWSDGCETDLSSDPAHCGGCHNACVPAGANTAEGCSKGKCTVTCIAPYEDCNNDLGDGCEIPVGVPNSCDRKGLTTFDSAAGGTTGCGTPHCGAAIPGTPDESFGTWHCSFCSHCKLFDDGYAWCLPSLGRFSLQRCSDCCKPNGPKFPQVCQ